MGYISHQNEPLLARVCYRTFLFSFLLTGISPPEWRFTSRFISRRNRGHLVPAISYCSTPSGYQLLLLRRLERLLLPSSFTLRANPDSFAMTDAQVASNFVHAVRRRKHIRLIRYRRVSRAILDQSTPSGFAIGEDGSIILDNGKIIRDGGSTTSSSQSSLAVATSTTSGHPNRQTIQAISTIPSSTPSTNALSLPQTSPVVYTPQDTSPPAPSPSPTTILMSTVLPPSPVKLITEVTAQLSQVSSGTFTPPDIVVTTTTFSPSRSPSTLVATAT